MLSIGRLPIGSIFLFTLRVLCSKIGLFIVEGISNEEEKVKKVFVIGLTIIMCICFVQVNANAGNFNFNQWCKKFADAESGGKYMERQFFLLFDSLDAEFSDATTERIVTTSYIIWVQNFQSQGFSTSYYDFIRTFNKFVNGLSSNNGFDETFQAYCTALLIGAHIPD